MINMTKRYVTRSKKPVRILAIDLANQMTPVIAAVIEKNTEHIVRYYSSGRLDENRENYYDLIEYKPEEDYVLDQKIC